MSHKENKPRGFNTGMNTVLSFLYTVPQRLAFYIEFLIYLAAVFGSSVVHFLFKWWGVWLDHRDRFEDRDYCFVRDRIIESLSKKLGLSPTYSIEVGMTSSPGVGVSSFSERITLSTLDHPFLKSICMEFCKTEKDSFFNWVRVKKLSFKDEKVSKKQISSVLKEIVATVQRSTNNKEFRKTHEYSVPFYDYHVNKIVLLFFFRSYHNKSVFDAMKNRSINFIKGSIEFSWDSFKTTYYLLFLDNDYEFGVYIPHKNLNNFRQVCIKDGLPIYSTTKNELFSAIEQMVYHVESY